MVLRAAHHEGNHFVIFANPCEVCPQLRLAIFGDGIAAVLGAENQMHMVSRKGMCHCVAPSGLYPNNTLGPTAEAVGYNISPLSGLVTIPQDQITIKNKGRATM